MVTSGPFGPTSFPLGAASAASRRWTSGFSRSVALTGSVAGADGLTIRAFVARAVPNRNIRNSPSLQRPHRLQELIGEGGDRLQEALRLEPASQQRGEDDDADDPRNWSRLCLPCGGRGPEKEDHGAQLTDKEQKRREDEDGTRRGRELVRDELDEEPPGKADERRRADREERAAEGGHEPDPVQEVLDLHDLRDLGQEPREREDLCERDERRRYEDAEVEAQRGGRDLAGEQRGMRVERDRREQEREGDHEDHREENERGRGLVLGEARGERERRDAHAAAKRDEREVARRGLDAPVPLDLERERADRHQESEHEHAADREGGGERDDAEGGRADGERGGKEVVRRLLGDDVEHEDEERREHDERRKAPEGPQAQLEVEQGSGAVGGGEPDEDERDRDREK